MLGRKTVADRQATSGAGPLRFRVDLMGVPLGFAAVAQCWSASRLILRGLPTWSVNFWWLSSAGLAGIMLVGCVLDLRTHTRLGIEARDATMAPFLALTPLLLVVYGPALGTHDAKIGRGVFVLGLVLLATLGSWLSGWWILGTAPVERWHPGYLLPTAIGGLVTAGSAALLGYQTLAQLAYGWGLVSSVVIGSLVVGRLTLGAPLPPGLTPTLAILAAPPAAAADAWLLMDGGHRGAVVGGFAGYVVLMVGVQLFFQPTFRRMPFGAGWWALVVSYTTVAAFALDWLARSSLPSATQRSGAVAALAAVSIGTAALAIRSAAAVLAAVAVAPRGHAIRRSALSPAGQTPTAEASTGRPGKESRWPRWSR